MEPFIGQIQMFGFNFAPRGWAVCEGQLLPINQNQALFSLLGTIYGGDGRTTFALPDFRGRVPMHYGTGAGLSSYPIGGRGGQERTTLNVTNLPPHNHPAAGPQLKATSNPANTSDPNGASLAMVPGYNNTTPPTTDMAAGSIDHPAAGNAGNGIAFSNVQPYLTVNFCIALVGIFPSRS